jgi:hypothetical protein
VTQLAGLCVGLLPPRLTVEYIVIVIIIIIRGDIWSYFL